jgi:hypothetical protein
MDKYVSLLYSVNNLNQTFEYRRNYLINIHNYFTDEITPFGTVKPDALMQRFSEYEEEEVRGYFENQHRKGLFNKVLSLFKQGRDYIDSNIYKETHETLKEIRKPDLEKEEAFNLKYKNTLSLLNEQFLKTINSYLGKSFLHEVNEVFKHVDTPEVVKYREVLQLLLAASILQPGILLSPALYSLMKSALNVQPDLPLDERIGVMLKQAIDIPVHAIDIDLEDELYETTLLKEQIELFKRRMDYEGELFWKSVELSKQLSRIKRFFIMGTLDEGDRDLHSTVYTNSPELLATKL